MRDLAVKSDIGDMVKKAEQGIRLSFEDGVRLFKSNSILSIGWAADVVRRRLNGERTYYIVNRHINYTNVCKNRCRFCAFSKSEGEPGAYTLSISEIVRKAEDARRDVDFTELHLVGGLHPTLPLDYYLEMLSELSGRMP
ncbi:MAG: radical SAM protein, partial [Armatimonadetes bacterium]|nr:radical SAM protein [Armatimonadota bacterium]